MAGISRFHVLQDDAETLNTWGGKIKHRFISYFLDNVFCSKIIKISCLSKVITSQRWDVVLRHRVCVKITNSPTAGVADHGWKAYLNTQHTRTVLRPFVQDYPGEPVPEETLTHPPFWSSSNLYQLLPFTTIRSILPVEITCLAIFLHNLSPCPLWYTSWSGDLHLIFLTFLHPIRVFFSQHMPIPLQPVLLQYQYYIIYFLSFSQLLTWNSVFYFNITHPSDHSHLCLLKCHLIFSAHAHTIATCFAAVSILYHLFLVFLSTPYLELCLLL